MTSLRRLTEKELSAQLSRADEQMMHKAMEAQQDVDAGRITAEQGDYKIQDLLDARNATKLEIESEQFRREKNRNFRNGILTAFSVMFVAGMVYFLFFK